jgi:hypothetical protein
MPGLALLLIILVALLFGGAIFAVVTGKLNERRRGRAGDKDLGVEDAADVRPEHHAVATEIQPDPR